jgi:dTDP-4-amino-4,6-dideoxygalactose transaminase
MTPALTHAVSFFDYRQTFAAEEEDLAAIFRDTVRRGAFVLQRDLARFEQNLAAILGVRHAFGVGNATDGLLIALRAAGVGSGDEVIFCSHTMVATAAAIHFAGAVPVPVECGADHLMDPEEAEAAVTRRTRAILVTQLNGRTADMDALSSVGQRHGLSIIEDAAQALGSRFTGRPAGTFGTAAAISFYPAKILGCLGDGGAIITNDDDVAERVAQFRDHGRAADGEIVGWGLNSRLDNLQAAILDHRLRSLNRAIERRRAIARHYQAALGDLEELVLPPGPDADPDHFDVFQNYEMEAANRDELRTFLCKREIGTALPWGGKAVHQWEALGFQAHLPRTDALFRRVVLLPMNPALTDDDLEWVTNAVREFYRSQ